MNWRVSDADGTVWRKSLRVATTTPIVLAAALALGPRSASGFAAFAVIASTGIADFGGPRRSRFGAYVALSLVGLVYIVVGTVTSDHIALAVLAAVLLGFGTRLAGVFGGYYAQGNLAALLAFALAVMDQGTWDDVPARAAMWMAGSAAATASAFLVFPRRSRAGMRTKAADVLDDAAATMRAVLDGTATEAGRATLRDATDELHRLTTVSSERPSGPGARDQALLGLCSALRRLPPFVTQLRQPPAELPIEHDLVESTAHTFAASARALRTQEGEVEVAALAQVRDEHHHAFARWAEGGDATTVVGELEASFPARVLSAHAEEIAVLAHVATGLPLVGVADPHGIRPMLAPSWTARASRLLHTHLTFNSAWMLTAVRAGMAMGLAVGVAVATDFDHGFWIILGTLSVLRTDAVSTTETAFQAVFGTLLGFLIATGYVLVTDESSAALWVAFPAVCFVGMYAQAINPIAGQAAFALLVVVLFNILAPGGWETGLVRLETVTIGAAIGAVAALLFWPHGASSVLRRDLAQSYRSASRLVGLAVRRMRTREASDELGACRTATLDTCSRATEAFSEYLAEQRGRGTHWSVWGPVLRAPQHVCFAASILSDDQHAIGRLSGCERALDDMGAAGAMLQRALDRAADRLDGAAVQGGSPSTEIVRDDAGTRADLVHCVASRQLDGDGTDRELQLVWSMAWLEVLADSLAQLSGPLDQICAEIQTGAPAGRTISATSAT